MRAKRIAHAFATGLAVSLTVAVAGCGEATDKAGGDEPADTVVLTLANNNDGPPPQLSAWAEEVERLSDGALRIEFKNDWRLDEPEQETGTIEDVQEATVDMAWVGARAFDSVGVTSFQALLAPLLVDSYDLQAAVFDAGIPARMLESVDDIGLAGIGVLPGPLRKMMGVSQPFLTPADFAGQVVGTSGGELAEQAIEALGATPMRVPAQTSLDGLDALDYQLSAIFGNEYQAEASHVTANLNLWPRPLVLFMNADRFDGLTSEQQGILRDAAAATIEPAMEESRGEDTEAGPNLCRSTMEVVEATPGQLAELAAAMEPLYAELETDAETKAFLDEIRALKDETAAAPESIECTEGESETSAISPIDGSYETSFSKEELASSPLLYEPGEVNDQNWGDFTLTLAAGRVTWTQENQVDSYTYNGTFTVVGDVVEMDMSNGERFTMRWSLYQDTLTLQRDEALGIAPTPFLLKPWQRIG
ncbi:MAG: TRAP transporter substrate-binding protein DctP [Actinomycetota bacterium]|nr:TRAP transporter substrate-binding protein DctP [Actinomycetota bacterium]